MSGLLLGMVLSVCICWFHSMVTLPPWHVSADFGTCSYQCLVSICTAVSLHMLKCSCAPTLSCLLLLLSFYGRWPHLCWNRQVFCWGQLDYQVLYEEQSKPFTFLTNHGSFRSYLHKINKLPSPHCNCPENPIQTAHHLMFNCSLLSTDRPPVLKLSHRRCFFNTV
jgi:hypothetical protein